MKQVLIVLIKEELKKGTEDLEARIADKLLYLVEGQKNVIEKLFPENELLKSMLDEKEKLEKRMLEALMCVWNQLEDGVLVAMDPKNIKDFVFMMNIVQGAIVQAQGGHRGCVHE